MVRLTVAGAGQDPRVGAIDRMKRVLDLNETEVGRLFGISRQAVTSWRAKGVPASRSRRLADILRVVDILEMQLLPDRIPGVVRTPASTLGERTVLEVLADEDAHDLLVTLRTAFDWDPA